MLSEIWRSSLKIIVLVVSLRMIWIRLIRSPTGKGVQFKVKPIGTPPWIIAWNHSNQFSSWRPKIFWIETLLLIVHVEFCRAIRGQYKRVGTLVFEKILRLTESLKIRVSVFIAASDQFDGQQVEWSNAPVVNWNWPLLAERERWLTANLTVKGVGRFSQ